MKTIFLVLAALAATASAAEFTCSTAGVFPDPNTCFRYYQCSEDSQEATEFLCQNGDYFDTVTKKCSSPQTAICWLKQQPTSQFPTPIQKILDELNTKTEAKIVADKTALQKIVAAKKKLIEDLKKITQQAERQPIKELAAEQEAEAIDYLTTVLETKTPQAAEEEAGITDYLSSVIETKAPKAQPRGLIYLTFDDGPNVGTSEAASVLREESVAASFFINADSLTNKHWLAPKEAFLKVVMGGNLVGDISFGQAKREDGSYGLGDYPEGVFKTYGDRNVNPVLDLLEAGKVPFPVARRTAESMNTFARTPFCNYWRVYLPRVRERLYADDESCQYSHPAAIDVADMLADSGRQVFGWDMEWPVHYTAGVPLITGEYMLKQVTHAAQKPMSERKFVVLTHDAGFASAEGKKQLRSFLRRAKEEGYVFRTLDTYGWD